MAVVVFGAAAAWAGKKTVVVAAGDCADPSLISGAREFRDLSSRLLGPQLMEPEVVLDIVRPRPTRSLSDIERQLDSARALFYGGQADRAAALVDRALEELDRASPEASPWGATQKALVLKALIARNLERPRDMAEAFRRIVRLDPSFQLDPDAHPPSAIAALDAVKRELVRARKVPVLLRVDAGPVATVFLDGHPMGTTPLKLDLVPGAYRVALTSGAMVSFPHRLEVPRDTKLSVDLAFEGSLGTQAPLCLSGDAEASAVKLAQLVAAESVIVLRNLGKRGDPPYLSGTVFELASGTQERAGSVQPELLANLATFLVTGREMNGVAKSGVAPVGGAPRVTTATKAEPPPVADVPRAEPEESAPLVLAPAREPTFTVPPGAPVGRIVSFTLIGLGAAAVLTGVIAYVAGAPDRERLFGISDSSGRLPPFATAPIVANEALALMQNIDTNRALSLGLIGGGLGATVAGVVGAVLYPLSGTKLSAGVTPSGASLQVRGAF